MFPLYQMIVNHFQSLLMDDKNLKAEVQEEWFLRFIRFVIIANVCFYFILFT